MQKLNLFTILLLLFLLIGAPFPAFSQKQLKPVRLALKAKNYGEALKQVEALEKDSVAATLTRLYLYGVEANIGLNDAENERIYLKQNYDTVKFFSTTRAILDYVLKAEACERKAEGALSKKSMKELSGLVERYYPNLNAAGRYYFTKQKYTEAMPYFRLFLDLPTCEIGKGVKAACETSTYRTNAYLYLRSAFKAKEYAEVRRYKDLALRDTSLALRTTLETLALTGEAEGDTVLYRAYLEEGWKKYPSYSFFFTRLADYHTALKNDAEVLCMAEKQLAEDSLNIYALVAKTVVLMQRGDYADAIAVGEKSLLVDSAQAEMRFYIGTAYCNLAAAVKLPDNINSRAYRTALAEQKAYYRKAMPYIEQYRDAAPAERDRWAPMLYRIYLVLNEGEKFEQISKEMQTLEYIDQVRGRK